MLAVLPACTEVPVDTGEVCRDFYGGQGDPLTSDEVGLFVYRCEMGHCIRADDAVPNDMNVLTCPHDGSLLEV